VVTTIVLGSGSRPSGNWAVTQIWSASEIISKVANG
jgi:hypothetical protein